MYEKIVLVGNLGRDPEMRYLADGTPVCNFSVATNQRWTQDGEAKERTTWWRIAAWRRQAETCNQYLSRGSKVLVEGRMNPDPKTGGPRVYTRNDGTPGASYEITAQTVKFLTPRGGEAPAEGDYTETDHDEKVEDEQQIPF